MRRARRRWHLSAGVAIAGTSLIAMAVAAPIPHVQVRDVRLTSGDGADSPLGDGTALVMGGSAPVTSSARSAIRPRPTLR
jgi:hypothetical protein